MKTSLIFKVVSGTEKGAQGGEPREKNGPDWLAYCILYGIKRALPLAVYVFRVLLRVWMLVVVESILYLVFLLTILSSITS
jgi:hypothetical protein